MKRQQTWYPPETCCASLTRFRISKSSMRIVLGQVPRAIHRQMSRRRARMGAPVVHGHLHSIYLLTRQRPHLDQALLDHRFLLHHHSLLLRPSPALSLYPVSQGQRDQDRHRWTQLNLSHHLHPAQSLLLLLSSSSHLVPNPAPHCLCQIKHQFRRKRTSRRAGARRIRIVSHLHLLIQGADQKSRVKTRIHHLTSKSSWIK